MKTSWDPFLAERASGWIVVLRDIPISRIDMKRL